MFHMSFVHSARNERFRMGIRDLEERESVLSHYSIPLNSEDDRETTRKRAADGMFRRLCKL